MKKLTSLTICCTLMLAGAALAKKPENPASPGAKPASAEKGQGQAKPEKKAKARAPQGEPQQNAKKPAGDTMKNHRAEKMPAAPKEAKTAVAPKTTEMPGAPKANAKGARGKKAADETATAAAPADKADATSSAVAAEGKKDMKSAKGRAKAGAAPAVAATSVAAGAALQGDATAKQPEPQQMEKIKKQHANFRAQPRPNEVPAVSFSANYQIQGANSWQGPQYEVYRSYRPERHDRNYYHSNYNRVELFGGGYYYINNGYWFPAWGYDPSNEYYAYDAPIYVGSRGMPPDRIIADVQAALQAMGYYRGEVDGLLGPLTREALRGYQSRQALTVTAVIDEPTLDALGMG